MKLYCRIPLVTLAVTACSDDPPAQPAPEPPAPIVGASPSGGNFVGPTEVTLRCQVIGDDACDLIFFTTDGSPATSSSALYVGAIELAADTQLNFMGLSDRGVTSTMVTEDYVIAPAPPTTRASPPGFTYDDAVLVDLSCDRALGPPCDATYFTTDGTPPTPASPRYAVPILVDTDTVLQFFSTNTLGQAEAVKSQTYVINTDTDGDGLRDADEIGIWFTSPRLVDTDGDSYSDYDEVVTLGFDPSTNNYRFNPRIADVPKIDIELVSAPDVGIDIQTSTGSTVTVSNSQSNSTNSSVTTSRTRSQSASVETERTRSTSASVGTETSVSSSYSESDRRSKSRSFSYSKSQSVGNSQTWQSAQATANQQGATAVSGFMSVAVDVRNVGDIAFTLTHLNLNAVRALHQSNSDDPNALSLVPIGNLDLDTAFETFPVTTLSPGQAVNGLVFSKFDLPVPVAEQVLRHSTSLVVSAGSFEMLGGDGTPLAHSSTSVQANTVHVIVDYGPERDVESYQVAVGYRAGQHVISLTDALDVLAIPFTTGSMAWELDSGTMGLEMTASSILSVRGDASAYGQRRRWVAKHVYNPGVAPVVDVYDPTDAGLDPDALTLRAGQVFELNYIVDADRDGLGEREEFLRGTDTTTDDTDGDGVTDFDEVYGWDVSVTESTGSSLRRVFSDPLSTDTDGDGLSDSAEAGNGTDPSRIDTDGDWLFDSADLNATSYDGVSITGLTTSLIDQGGSWDVDVSWAQPPLAGLGVADYAVMLLRHAVVPATASNPPLFFDLAETPADFFSYNPSDTFDCVDAAGAPQPGCYTVAHFESGIPPSVTMLSADVNLSANEAAQYLTYVRVNNRWFRSAETAVASTGVDYSLVRFTYVSYTMDECLDVVGTPTNPCDTYWRLWVDGVLRYQITEANDINMLTGETTVVNQLHAQLLPKIEGQCITFTPVVREEESGADWSTYSAYEMTICYLGGVWRFDDGTSLPVGPTNTGSLDIDSSSGIVRVHATFEIDIVNP